MRICPPLERKAASSIRRVSLFPTTAFSTSSMIFSEYFTNWSIVISFAGSFIMAYLQIRLHPLDGFLDRGLVQPGPPTCPPAERQEMQTMASGQSFLHRLRLQKPADGRR